MLAGARSVRTWDAQALARELLAHLGDRWAHTQGVAATASEAAVTLPDTDRTALVSAAWLHDVGYAPECVRTGFHALDGASYILQQGFGPRIAALVAHHSMSAHEARARGLRLDLDQFDRETGPVADMLTWADMTTDPQGQPVRAQDRIAEILDRYPPNDPVHEAIRGAAPEIVACVVRTEERLTATAR